MKQPRIDERSRGPVSAVPAVMTLPMMALVVIAGCAKNAGHTDSAETAARVADGAVSPDMTAPPQPTDARVKPSQSSAPAPAAGADQSANPPAGRPNILWIVWDAVRTDHMSLYGYPRPTTPKLARWAKKARVYTNMMAAATASTSAYATMLTGLFPSEHGVNYEQRFLPGQLTTIAELLSGAGYQTFLYSAHPGVTDGNNFDQGFDLVQYPWSEPYRDDAFALVKQKVPLDDMSSEITRRIHSMSVGNWAYKAAGIFGQYALLGWLTDRDQTQPWFATMIYTEAHRPHLPSMDYRIRAMGAERAEQSRHVERIKVRIWAYTFGAPSYTDEQLEVLNGMYDATIMELDDEFDELIKALDVQGYLDNTIVVLTADHGDLHGDHHVVGHDFVMYEQLLRIPMILYGPGRIQPGVEQRPVSQVDIAATIADWAGVTMPAAMTRHAVSLLSPKPQRLRFAEYPTYHKKALEIMKFYAPDFDPTPWQRSLRCVRDDRYKLIWASDGRHQLFDLTTDPLETRNVIDARLTEAKRLRAALEQTLPHAAAVPPPPSPSP